MNRRVLASVPPRIPDAETLSGANISALAGERILPDFPDRAHIPYIHFSALLDSPWNEAEVVVHEKEAGTMLPLLLSMGVQASRVVMWSMQGFTPLRERNYSSSPEFEKLSPLWNIHAGRRAFIIGNGPSLQIPDLDRLKDELTFASNKIYLAYDQTSWRPTYYTVCDYLVAQNNAEKINALQETKLFPSTLRRYGCDCDVAIQYQERFDNKAFDNQAASTGHDGDFLFSTDARFGVQGGYTVIYHQLQLAFYMGIREAYFIGVDFHFDVPKAIAEDLRFTSEVYRKALSSAGECNHFHPDYRSPNEKWSMPRMDMQEMAFKAAGKAFEKAGGRLVNASRKSALTVLSRVTFDDLFQAEGMS